MCGHLTPIVLCFQAQARHLKQQEKSHLLPHYSHKKAAEVGIYFLLGAMTSLEKTGSEQQGDQI